MSPNFARSLFASRAHPQAFQACAGGDNRDRTDDPLLAKQVLSQLSYTPRSRFQGPKQTSKIKQRLNLGPNGLLSRPDLGF